MSQLIGRRVKYSHINNEYNVIGEGVIIDSFLDSTRRYDSFNNESFLSVTRYLVKLDDGKVNILSPYQIHSIIN